MPHGTINQWYVFHDPIPNKIIKKLWKVVGTDWEPSSVDVSGYASDEERISGKKPDWQEAPETRISDVIWCNDQWLYDIIFPFMAQANEEAGWKYDIKMAESVQITRYKPGGFYKWHNDGMNDHVVTIKDASNPEMNGLVRKLSMTILLNDKFEGGEFEMMHYSKGESSIAQPFEKHRKGDVIVFPSVEEHRVTPVTRGTRYSAVVWFLGPPMV